MHHFFVVLLYTCLRAQPEEYIVVEMLATVYRTIVLLRRCSPHVRVAVLVLYVCYTSTSPSITACWRYGTYYSTNKHVRVPYTWYSCNSCCRENLAQPIICSARQLSRVDGLWTAVVVRSQDRRQAPIHYCWGLQQ